MSVKIINRPTIMQTIGLGGRLKPGIVRRIEMIGKLNDRRVKALAAGDRLELLRLAEEYETHNMPTMAWILRDEIGVT